MLEGNRREDSLDYPDEEYFYYLCAKEFGWTPSEVDEQPAAILDWLISIHNVVRQVENDSE